MADDFDAFPTVDEAPAQSAPAPAPSDFSDFPAVAPRNVEEWDPYLSEAANKYGVDPNLLKAISRQENVNPGHMNPLGISPHNGGPASYNSVEEAQSAIDRQVALMTDPRGPYGDIRTKTIPQIAAVYSPVGASNDVHGTNATEASGIAENYQKLSTGGKADWSQFPQVENQGAPSAAAAQSWDAFPVVDAPRAELVNPPRPAGEQATSQQDAQFLANPENVPQPQTPQGVPQKLPWEAEKGILTEPLQQAWSNLFGQGSQAAAGLDVAGAKERLAQAEAGEQKPTSLFGGGPEAKEAEELRNPNISQADAQEIIARRRERTDMDRQLAEADLSRAQTEQAKAEAATPGPEYQRTIPGIVTGFLGRAAPWMLSSTLGAAAPFGVASQMSEQAYGDAYNRSIEAGRKAHPDWTDEQLNAAAHQAGTDAAQSGFENGVVMGLLHVPKVGGLITRLVSTLGLRGTYMTVVGASQDIENNIAVKKNADPNQDIYDGVLAHAPQNFTSGVALGIPEAIGHALQGPAARPGEPQARPEVMPGMTTPQEPQAPPSGQRGAVVEENGEAAEEAAAPEREVETVKRPMTPAVRTSEGEIRTGAAHFEAAEGLPEDVNLEQGYVTADGRFVSPEQAADELSPRPPSPLEETIERERERVPEAPTREEGLPEPQESEARPTSAITEAIDRERERTQAPEEAAWEEQQRQQAIAEANEEARGSANQPNLLREVQRAGGLPTPRRLNELAQGGETMTGEVRRVLDAWKALPAESKTWLKKLGVMPTKLFRNDAPPLDEMRGNLAQGRGTAYGRVDEMLGEIENAIALAREKREGLGNTYAEEAETFAGLGVPKKVRRAAFDIFSDITRNVYERVKGAPHGAQLAGAYKDYLNTRAEVEGKIAQADHGFNQLKKEQPDLDERIHQIGKYVEANRGALPAGMSRQETEVVLGPAGINSGVARDIGDEARRIGLKVRVPTSVDPSGWRLFRGAPPGVPVFLRIMRPDVRATLQEALTTRDPATLGRPVQESDLTEGAKKLYKEGQNEINKNTGKPYFQTPDDLLKWAAEFKTRERQTAAETSLAKGRLAAYPTFFYTYSPQATLGLLTRQAQEIARKKAFGQNTGQGDLFTKAQADVNANHSLSDAQAESATRAFADMQRDVYQLNKRGPLGRVIGGLTSIGLAAKLETSMKVLGSSLFTTGPYRGSLRTLAAIARAAIGRGMPFDEFRRLGLASDIITNISDDPRAVTTAQQRASNFFRGSMKLAGHLASQDIARSITAAVSKSWLTKWAIPQLLKDPTGRQAVTKRLMADIRSRGMDPADFVKGNISQSLIDRWVREDTLNLQTSYRPGSYPGWWSTPQGSFMVRFGHWSYDMSQRLVRDTLVPLARATRAGDIPLAGLYAARLTSAVAAQVAGEELIRKIKELFGQQSGVATFGEIWKAFATDNPAGAHLLMTRLGSDLIGGPVFGMFSDIGQWVYGVSTGTADTTHAFNPASPASVAYMKIMWDAVNQMAQQGGKLSSKQIERTTSSLSGMVRSWMDLAHTAGAPVPNIPALGVTGHSIEMGRRDVQFVRGRQTTFYTEHPQFDKRSKGGAFAGNARTPYLQNINDALVSGDAPEARRQMVDMQKNLGLTPKETQSTVRESVDREKPIPTGSGGIAFTTWGRVNMTPEELRRMYRIDGVYRRTAAALGVEMK